MKPSWLILLCLCILAAVPCMGAGTGKPTPKADSMPPTKATILALADSYIAAIGPKLTGTDFQTINTLKFDLDSAKSQPFFLKQVISDRVSQFTILLADQKSLPALTVACAYLVHYAPTNQRTTNLLANVVALVPKRDDVVTLLQYTLQLQPDSTLAMINLANAYMNANKDEKARVLLEKVVTLDPKNGRAYRMLACYWYKKGDKNRTVDCLMKAAALNGARLKKSKQNEETTQENEAKGSDTEEALGRKADAMKDLVPLSTADVIENDFPDIAKKIREHVGKLMDNERMRLPALPQMNTNDLKDYVRNAPIYKEWNQVVTTHAENVINEIAESNAAEMGISPDDSDAVKESKARTATDKQVQEAIANAQKMLAAMKNMPGVTQEEIAQAERELQNTLREQGIHPPDAGNGNGGESATSPALPNIAAYADTGGMYAGQNYRDYLRIRDAYTVYLRTTYQNYSDKVRAIGEAYAKLVKQENEDHVKQDKQISDEEEHARQAAEQGDGVTLNTTYDLKHKKERLRHLRKLNELGTNFYRQWVNLYMPQYVQKMKPRLEEFWYVTTLYIRNMNDPKYMTREYRQIRQTYWTYATLATGAIAGGEMFPYSAESEEEMAQLEEEIHTAEVEAEEQKKAQFEDQTKIADDSLPKWLEDKLVFSVACEFLAIKITPRNIEFEAYLPGVSGKVDYNFKENTVTTSTALTARMNIGVQIGPLEAKLDGEIKLLGSKTTFDLNSSKVREDSDGFANGSIKGTFGKADSEWKGWTAGGDPDNGGLKARAGATIQIDPALDNELSGTVFLTAPGTNLTAKY